MNDEVYDDMALEQNAKKQFGVHFEIDTVVARNIPVGRSVSASVILTKKKQLYVYIDGQARLLLSDVKKIISRMGMTAELYIPPKGQIDYFDEIGRTKFQEVFPARNDPSSEDIIYYRTLAAYKPALVQILEIKNGEIFQYESDSSSGWRPATKFAYRRIRTS